LYWTLLDRAAKAGKPNLNGGTPVRRYPGNKSIWA